MGKKECENERQRNENNFSSLTVVCMGEKS